MYNLMRNEYSPRFCSSPHALDEYPAEMYVICTPSVPFSRSEIDRLEQFVDDGGWLMIAAGWDKREAVGPLLDRFGLAIDNIPLGEAEAFGMGKTVKMKNAYPVKGQGEGVETLITAFDYPVAKVVRRGTGGVIEIGDSEFLLNMNLEGQNDFLVMENIVFLRSLMATLNQDPS